MTLTRYTLMLLVATLIAWSGFAVVITQINPQTTGYDGFLLFYISLFFCLLASFSLIGLLIRLKTQKQHLPYYVVLLSFRQAIFFSLLVIGALLLQSQKALYWWNMVLLVIGLTAVEFFALRRVRRTPSP
ncbi:hypothetical protein HZA86_03175 [Candidatus Uhrbacteria bacterium]|nr:hypothetical protein [Candidatus Uhrbacteria bacterium]